MDIDIFPHAFIFMKVRKALKINFHKINTWNHQNFFSLRITHNGKNILVALKLFFKRLSKCLDKRITYRRHVKSQRDWIVHQHDNIVPLIQNYIKKKTF